MMIDSRFRTSLRRGAFFAALMSALLTMLAIPAAPARAATAERAAIVPVTNQYAGNGLNSAVGFSLFANGISAYWATANPQTVNFFVFVSPTQQVTQDVTFSVFAPGGKTVYTYTFKAQSITVTGTWFMIAASGDYSQTGIYRAAVTANGEEIGSLSIVLAPASK